jgi:hypothetical protein
MLPPPTAIASGCAGERIVACSRALSVRARWSRRLSRASCRAIESLVRRSHSFQVCGPPNSGPAGPAQLASRCAPAPAPPAPTTVTVTPICPGRPRLSVRPGDARPRRVASGHAEREGHAHASSSASTSTRPAVAALPHVPFSGMLKPPRQPQNGRHVVGQRGRVASAHQRATTEERHGWSLNGHNRLCATDGDGNDDRRDKIRDQR